MKPFVAFKVSSHSLPDVGFRVDRAFGGGTQIAYVEGRQASSDDWGGPDHCLWWFDSAEAARAFCQMMAAKYPSVQYGWAETKGMFASKPTAPVESSVSVKGVLPV